VTSKISFLLTVEEPNGFTIHGNDTRTGHEAEELLEYLMACELFSGAAEVTLDVAEAAPGPGITCPRCRETSHNPRDVEEKFCARCGYHADFPPLPAGARKGPPNVRAGKLHSVMERIASSCDGWARQLARGALDEDAKIRAKEAE
jgi:hypothetical protein